MPRCYHLATAFLMLLSTVASANPPAVQATRPVASSANPIAGQLLDSAGKPLAGVKMALTISKQNMWQPQVPGPSYSGGKEIADLWYSITDASGRFSFPAQSTPYLILAFTDEGYVLTRTRQLTFPLTLKLTPWAKLEGQVMIADKPAPAGICVYAEYADEYRPQGDADDLGPWPHFYALTDRRGHFTMDRVLAGHYSVARSGPSGRGVAVAVDAPAGKATQLVIPIIGKPVKGRIVVPPELAGLKYRPDLARLNTPIVLPKITLPENILQMTTAQRLQWYNQWELTSSGQRHANMRAAIKDDRGRDSMLDADGSFQLVEVPPGKWFVEVHFYALSDTGMLDYNKQLAVAAYEFTAPPFDVSDLSTIDLGALTPRPLETTNAGQQAPDIVFPTLTGKDMRLSDFKGKVVLLDFWGTWCGVCIQQLPDLKAINAAYGTNPNFVIISLSAGDERAALEKAVRDKQMPWTHGILGPFDDAWPAKLFAVPGYPAYWLIGADGQVLANGWQCKGMQPYIERALKVLK